MVLIVPAHPTANPGTAVGAFAVTPDPGDGAGRADGAAVLGVTVAAAAAADGVGRRG